MTEKKSKSDHNVRKYRLVNTLAASFSTTVWWDELAGRRHHHCACAWSIDHNRHFPPQQQEPSLTFVSCTCNEHGHLWFDCLHEPLYFAVAYVRVLDPVEDTSCSIPFKWRQRFVKAAHTGPTILLYAWFWLSGHKRLFEAKLGPRSMPWLKGGDHWTTIRSKGVSFAKKFT